MYISTHDAIKLNYLSRGDGAEALELLAKLIYDFHASAMITAEGTELLKTQGKLQLADYLRTLPKGLRDGYESNRAG